MTFVVPPGYKLTPFNTVRSSRLIYAYTATNEPKVARSVTALWNAQREKIITPELIKHAMTNAQLSQEAILELRESLELWINKKLAPFWEGSMSLGSTVILESIERYLGRSLGTMPNEKNIDRIFELSDSVIVSKKSVFVPKELKALIDNYYAGSWSPGFHTDFPEVAASMTDWIKTRGASEAIRYNEAQLQVWQNVINRGVVEQGINGADLALQLQDSTGLTVKMEAAVAKHSAALAAEGVSKTAIKKAAAKYSKTLRKQRALAIGRTELSDAYNSSRQITMVDNVESGVIKVSVVKKWYTAVDERVCPICSPLHGQIVGLKETWVSENEKTGKETKSGENPPIHAMCRCVVIYERVTQSNAA